MNSRGKERSKKGNEEREGGRKVEIFPQCLFKIWTSESQSKTPESKFLKLREGGSIEIFHLFNLHVR